MIGVINPHIAVCLGLTNAISRINTVDDIYSAALDALTEGIGVSRSSILLFDPDGVMRFKAIVGCPKRIGVPLKDTRRGHLIRQILNPCSSPTHRATLARAVPARARERASPGWRSSRS